MIEVDEQISSRLSKPICPAGLASIAPPKMRWIFALSTTRFTALRTCRSSNGRHGEVQTHPILEVAPVYEHLSPPLRSSRHRRRSGSLGLFTPSTK